jgi:hypothetical protein
MQISPIQVYVPSLGDSRLFVNESHFRCLLRSCILLLTVAYVILARAEVLKGSTYGKLIILHATCNYAYYLLECFDNPIMYFISNASIQIDRASCIQSLQNQANPKICEHVTSNHFHFFPIIVQFDR